MTATPATPHVEMDDSSVEEGYYELQQRLNPVDNRTGRRTKRRGSPGPPIRSDGPADLEYFRNNLPTGGRRTLITQAQRLATLIPETPVPAMVWTNAQEASTDIAQYLPTHQTDKSMTFNTNNIRKVSLLSKYLDGIKMNVTSPSGVESKTSNQVVYYDGNDSNSFKAKILRLFNCKKCGQFDYGNMVSCAEAGHLMCLSCSNHPVRVGDNIFQGGCDLCDKSKIYLLREALPYGLIGKVPLQCQYKHLGCADVVYEPVYGNHMKKCSKAWRCLFCSEYIQPENLEKHFESNMAGTGTQLHSPMSLLKSKYGPVKPNDEIVFDLCLPLSNAFAVGRVMVDGLGNFFLYQFVPEPLKVIWFVVHNKSIEEDTPKLEVEIQLTVTSCYRGKAPFIYKWINRVFPWKVKFIDSIKDIFEADVNLHKTAMLNYFQHLSLGEKNAKFECKLSLRIREMPRGLSGSYGYVYDLWKCSLN